MVLAPSAGLTVAPARAGPPQGSGSRDAAPCSEDMCRRAQIPHCGGTSGTPRTCKGMFSAYTQALRDRDLPEENIRVLNNIIPDLLFDLRDAGRPLRT